ncbi:ATP-binding cassette domain-containing protein [Streptomyces avermitilis]|uniref:ATP-binding cassette domain-containing protein n=1 Tax=Streptomyces avermitilis TaxID=33903 RepID=UPI0033AA3663
MIARTDLAGEGAKQFISRKPGCLWNQSILYGDQGGTGLGAHTARIAELASEAHPMITHKRSHQTDQLSQAAYVPVIETRGLARVFRSKGRNKGTIRAVRGIDLTVYRGEIVGFLGPNGAGKTTTLRMLTTLLRPNRGTAVVAGCDLLKDPEGVRRRIGYVAQGSGASPGSTVVEELILQGRLHKLSKSAASTRAADLIRQLDLHGLERRLVRTLSGGQQRRLDLAMGLIHQPELIFLDEPTTGLDPQSRANLWEHIKRLQTDYGVTTFLSTHYLHEADALCDRILIMDEGRIIAVGTADSLKASVSGDVVMLQVAPAYGAVTVEHVRSIDGAYEVSESDGSVRFRASRGDLTLRHVLRSLDFAGILITSFQVHNPSLDDVFLALTGRSLREPLDSSA